MANDELASKFLHDPEYRQACELKAQMWAKANPSDPFAYTVAMKDYRSGSIHPASEDYEVKWRGDTHQIQTVDEDGDPITVDHTVQVPTNMKRP